MVFRCPSIEEHYNEPVICLILGHLKIRNFSFGTNGKFIIFRCPNILAHYGNLFMSSIP